jgi:hypothetical protein
VFCAAFVEDEKKFMIYVYYERIDKEEKGR